ncbi:MAG: (Na+)-NQR maturation NqrM [Sinobacterium sp.]
MATFFFTLCFLLLVVAAMAVGVIFANKPIKGSCGGIQALGLGGDCDICGGDVDKCDEENERAAGEVKKAKPVFYNADK